jgi:hypothetical protein
MIRSINFLALQFCLTPEAHEIKWTGGTVTSGYACPLV